MEVEKKEQKERGWGTGKFGGQKQGVGPGSYLCLPNSKDTHGSRNLQESENRKSW